MRASLSMCAQILRESERERVHARASESSESERENVKQLVRVGGWIPIPCDEASLRM
jgi:hypothetical protein